eukprot:CAMPEP_0182837040 /NCGR_PEP_ID=MMETSP0006_2-20121128/22454_1 /TAXON_ID=97485 /ORGANISM="Prymnesium parvum, Strain Texoma1" /LENGTH=140 /DNA_ID=CAMNT_0024965763 /DNA_START=531 /DNA_END=949 /DNA_ORIENTATION=-
MCVHERDSSHADAQHLACCHAFLSSMIRVVIELKADTGNINGGGEPWLGSDDIEGQHCLCAIGEENAPPIGANDIPTTCLSTGGSASARWTSRWSTNFTEKSTEVGHDYFDKRAQVEREEHIGQLLECARRMAASMLVPA